MIYEFLSGITSPDDIKYMNFDQLKILSSEIREEIRNTVSQNGGHLASNLGVVELTIALHYVFESPKDKIIWDVGHQTYPHKLLTGRYAQFSTIRKHNGLSGFPKRKESVHDIFEVGHSSTSISASLGQEISRKLLKRSGNTICVIGDGAMTAGMAYEALNHMAELKSNVILVLNDNSMSIGPNTGGLSRHLDRLRTAKSYNNLKLIIKKALNRDFSEKNLFYRFLVKGRDFIKFLFLGSVFFEELGIKYLGPVDGHDLELLIDELENSKKLQRPVILHVTTKKGKGYSYAEANPESYHSVGTFDLSNGAPIKGKTSFSDVLGETLVQAAEENEKIVAITAAMSLGTGLEGFQKKYPERFFDVGIAEQHGVTFAAGLANGGLKPVFAVYSTFLQRAYDQVLHDVCLQKLPVVFAIDRAGLVGADGETHHGVFDIAFLRHIPNMILMSPWGKLEFQKMLEFSLQYESGPCAIRYPRGNCSGKQDKFAKEIALGEPVVVQEGTELCIFAFGNKNEIAKELTGRFSELGISITHVNLRFAKPLNLITLRKILNGHKMWVSLEDGCYEGGLGQWLKSELSSSLPHKVFAYPDEFIGHGEVPELLRDINCSNDDIFQQIYDILQGEKK